MAQEILILAITSLSLGFIHTLIGPDHYIPFIAMAKAGKWQLRKTIIITLLCGMGHILSSVMLGLVGIAFGIAVTRLTAIEYLRGEIAGWFLLIFGLIYFLFGIYIALKNSHHEHFLIKKSSGSGILGCSEMRNISDINKKNKKANLTPWILFTIFIFGPCEPLIPLIMYPAAKGSILGLMMVTGIFGITTIATMLAIVIITSLGVNFMPMEKFERYMHALAGLTILLCGIAIKFLGL